MTPPEFDERLARIEQIAAAVKEFENPTLQEAAYHYLIGDPATSSPHPRPRRTESPTPDPSQQDVKNLDDDLPPGDKKQTKAKSSGKKQSFDFDKELDLYAADGPSKMGLADFVAAHNPKNVESKVTVAVYWLKREAGLPAVTLGHIYTAFKTLNWKIPADLANAVQRAGTKNYVNSKNREDIGLTTHGENLVEHQLTAIPTL